MAQISDLQLFLQAKLEKTSIEEIDSPSTVDCIFLNTPVICRSAYKSAIKAGPL